MNFKHNDKVTCEINGNPITDARISIDEDGQPFICQNEISGNNKGEKLGYRYSWMTYRDFMNYAVTNLKLAGPKTMQDLAVGDVVVSTRGTERLILMRSGEVVILGDKKDYGYSAGHTYTIDELIHYVYTLKQDEVVPEVKEMTVAEIAEKLGHGFKIVK